MNFFSCKISKTIAVFVGALAFSGCLSTDQQKTSSPDFSSNPVIKTETTIAVLGATGLVGSYILDEALANGYKVRALARTPRKLERLKDQLTIVKGDATELSAIDALLQGSDIVISAIGPVKTDGQAAKNISTITTAHIVKLMPKHQIKRYIAVSGGAVKIPTDKRNLFGWLIQKLAAIRYPDTLKDKQNEYRLLSESTVQWTLVRCPLISNKPFKTPAIASLDSPTSFYLRAGELAQFVIEQISSKEFVRKGPFLESR